MTNSRSYVLYDNPLLKAEALVRVGKSDVGCFRAAGPSAYD